MDSAEYPQYTKWKNQRNETIAKMQPQLLTYSEAQINSFYIKLESEIQKTILSRTTADIFTCLHNMSVLFYFQRNFDVLSQCFPVLNSKLESNNKELVRAIMKTYSWMAQEVESPNAYFRDAFKSVQGLFKGQRVNLWNALLVLKSLKRGCKEDFENFVESNLAYFLGILINDNAEIRHMGFKIISFYLKNLK